MNQVQLIGRLGKEPEVRYTGNGFCTARFSLAVPRPPRKDGTKETDWINIVLFGKTAELAEKYCFKGQQVGISGRIQTGSYTNRDGQKVYTTEVVGDRLDIITWKDQQQPSGVDYQEDQFTF